MASRHEVSCINKIDRLNPHERITHIGGINYNSTRWRLTQQEAIEAIENGKYEFFVQVAGREVDIIVATRNGKKYLKTVPDGEQPNNLLSLNECRV